MYRCPRCYQDFLMAVDPCPGCVDLATEKAKAKKARDRRNGYDPTGKIEDGEFWDLLRFYNHCPCCARPWAAVEIIARDHIVPVSRGGPNEAKNLQPLCQECNLWKSDHIIYFDRYFPGRVAALPEHLRLYLPPEVLESHRQLALVEQAAPDFALRYPQGSARQLERLTLLLSSTEELEF